MFNWISIKERLPDEDGQYLCITKVNGQFHYQICLWQEGHWYWVHNVIKWMPLPDILMEVGVQDA